MIDQNKKEDMKLPEKGIPLSEQAIRFKHDAESIPERVLEKRIPSYEKIVSDELKREIEMMELEEKLKPEAEKAREKIEFLGEKDKIEHLLEIAREKGLVFAIQVAKKMNEPYLLDLLHDTLAQEGFYLKIGQTNSDDNHTQPAPNNNSPNSK